MLRWFVLVSLVYIQSWISPFSLFNATQILCIAFLPLCSPSWCLTHSTTQTVESKFSVKSIKNWVQNSAYHQKSINSWSISRADGDKSPKSGRSRSVRLISTLPPKPRAEGSSPSAPAKIAEQKRCSRRNPRIYGGFQRFRGQKMGFEFRRCIWPFLGYW